MYASLSRQSFLVGVLTSENLKLLCAQNSRSRCGDRLKQYGQNEMLSNKGSKCLKRRLVVRAGQERFGDEDCDDTQKQNIIQYGAK